MSPRVAILGVLLALTAGATARAETYVAMTYNIFLPSESYLDTVFVELYDDRPLTQANFLEYVDGGHYDGVVMHRLALIGEGTANERPFVVQGGGFYESYDPEPSPINFSFSDDERVDLDGDPDTANPTVATEYNISPIRPNVLGTISMAKASQGPDSATNQFFFNLGDNTDILSDAGQPSSGGFTVFGAVVGNSLALLDAYSSLARVNLNPDQYIENDLGQPLAFGQDGDRDQTGAYSEMPVLESGGQTQLLKVDEARTIDYYGDGDATDLPTGMDFLDQDAFLDTGSSFTGGGFIRVRNGRRLGIAEGVSMEQRLINHSGIVELGKAIGSVELRAYSNFGTATMVLQLAGTTEGEEYDQLLITEKAVLAGALRVERFAGFLPQAHDSFNVVTAGLIENDFDFYDLPTLEVGNVWNVTRTDTDITLTVVPADFNGNGIVDAADYSVWRDTLGSTTDLDADADGSGVVDQADYVIWQANFGATNPFDPFSVGQAAPEPTAAGLLAIGLMFVRTRRSRA